MLLSVVGAGLGRTGTMSLKLALERVGFGPRGGSVCLNSGLRCDKWSPAGFRLPRIAAAG